MQEKDQFEFNKYTSEKMNRTLFDVGLKKTFEDNLNMQKTEKQKQVGNDSPRRRRKAKKIKLKEKILIGIIIFLVAGSLVGYNLYNNTKQAITANQIEIQATTKTNFAKEPSNILIMGVDEAVNDSTKEWRANNPSESLADTLILIRFDPIQKTIVTSSIPRDTSIDNTCTKSNTSAEYKKINSTTVNVVGSNEQERIKNGMECMVQEYKNNFKIIINYVVRINMNVVMKVVDQIGGLEFAPDPINFGESTGGVLYAQDEYDHKDTYKFVAGQLTKFNGSQALAYGRVRTGDSDFFRGVRQQEVAKQIIKKMASSPTAINNLPNIIRSLNGDLQYNFGGEIIDDLFILAKDLNQYQTMPMEKFEMVKVSYGEDYVLSKDSQAKFEGVYNGKINLFAPTPTATPSTTKN